MKEVTARHKTLAKFVANAFGVVKPAITRFGDEAEHSEVFILKAPGSPHAGLTSYATIGLSDHPLMHEGREFNCRVELAFACSANQKLAGEILSTAAFCVINSHWFCAPGMIFPEVLELLDASETMADLYFAYPFSWDRLQTLPLDGKDVAWLQVIPIAKSETAFAFTHGPDKLEDLLKRSRVDVFDPERRPVV